MRTIDGRSDPFYRTALWLRTREAQLAAFPLCSDHKARGYVVVATEVDHITPIAAGGHRTDPANLNSLCHDCHTLKTNAEMGKAVRYGCDASGMPFVRSRAQGGGAGQKVLGLSGNDRHLPRACTSPESGT